MTREEGRVHQTAPDQWITALSDVANGDMTWQYKGWPALSGPLSIDEVGDQGWNIFTDDFLFPVMTLNRGVLHHNVETVSRFCTDHDISIAPHGKTTMSPELTRLQLDTGAWGITAATVNQARIFRAFGIDCILVANQVVDPGAVRWAWRELQAFPEFRFFCLVDSVEGVEAIERALADEPAGRPIEVLVELGMESGRSGNRTTEGAIEVAIDVGESDRLSLAGVEGYEGILHYEGDDFSAVDAFLHRLRELTERLADKAVFDHLSEVIVTAGGSMFPDRVVEILGGDWDIGRPVRTVIRLGGYVTHDSILYAESGPFGNRPPMDGYDRLVPALTLWSYVISRPEPNLVIAGFGKRDVSFDVDLPLPSHVRRGTELATLDRELQVFDLNDQHAYVRIPAEFKLGVGDMLGCGISHPCATFDRWRAMPLVDDDYNVLGAVRTFF